MTLIKKHQPATKLFPSFFDDIFTRDFFESPIAPIIRKQVPSVNIKENEKSFTLELAAPGMKKEDFNVHIEEDVLVLSAIHEEENENNEKEYTYREFRHSSFERRFTMPKSVNKEAISAQYEDGILKVELPKMEPEKNGNKRSIQVI